MAEEDPRASLFRARILEWGGEHRRSFPWRETSDPYLVLIAEMMLRRTRAEQVVPVYEKFIQFFPNAEALARASEEDIGRALWPLGLAWRVPAFRRVAQVLVEQYGGVVPGKREALLSLPGVGEYVADAVRCFAFGQPVPVVDTNTVRVAGRFLGFPVHAESRRRAAVKIAVASLVDGTRAKAANLALLDFAAMVCRAINPLHGECPVSEMCTFLQSRDVVTAEVGGSGG